MGQSRFERDTAVASLGDARYRGGVDPGWAVIAGAAPNGGYLLAMAARAMREPVPHPDPVTITAHFLAPPSNRRGPAASRHRRSWNASTTG